MDQNPHKDQHQYSHQGSATSASNGDTPTRAYHACVLVRGHEEAERAVRAFVLAGIAQGEKAVHIIDPADHVNHRQRLSAAGLAVDTLLHTGQLHLLGWDEAYRPQGTFDPDAMIEAVASIFHASEAAGFTHVRILGHMGWALDDPAILPDLIDYEDRVNTIYESGRGSGLCIYDIAKLPSERVVDVLRTHPAVIVGGALRTSPFYAREGDPAAESRRPE